MLQNQSNLKNLWPQFAGYKQPLRFAVVGDAVENGLSLALVKRAQQTSQIDPSHNFACLRSESCDAGAVPDIGEELYCEVFEFIELINVLSFIANIDLTI